MYVILFLLYLSDISLRLQKFGNTMFEVIIVFIILILIVKCLLTFFKVNYTSDDSKIAMNVDEYLSNIIKSKLLAICLVFSLLLSLFTPSDKILQVIAGLYGGNILIDQPIVNSLLDKSYKIIDSKLDEILKESNIKLKPLENKESL